MKVVVSNPGLGAHVRQTVKAYNDSNYLKIFFTTFLLNSNKLLSIASSKFGGIRSKQFSEIPISKIKRLFIPETLRLVSSKFLSTKTTDKIWEWSELFFDDWTAKQLNKSIDVFHGYEHASLFSLQQCKKLNLFSVYEQPSAHHKFVKENVILPLMEKEPYFKMNFKELYDSELSIKRNKRRDEELNLADLILCNSTYVKNTLLNAGIPEKKIVVNPLGFPTVVERKIQPKTSLRFLISGNLSYLKGTHHVLRVWRENAEHFKNHELVCVGSDTLSSNEWEGLPSNVLKKDRMNSVEYLEELNKSDVYILNTYSDGFGMVMSEAMAYGLAVIGTSNSAAPDIIRDNETGKVISPGDDDSLLESMKWMINNPNEVVNMRLASMEFARSNSWGTYRKQLPIIVEERYNMVNRNG